MKYFIIIDMQNDFCTGKLKNDAATAIIAKIAAKAAELKKEGYHIIATRDTHSDGYMNTQEGKLLPVPHCIKNSNGWEVVDEIKPFVDEYVDKPTFGYNGWNLKEEPEEIKICGTCTDICVVSNALILKAKYPEVQLDVYSELCAGLTPEKHNHALDVMQSCQCRLIKGE